MISILERCVWSTDNVAEVVEAVARHSRLVSTSETLSVSPTPDSADLDDLGRRLEAAADRLGLEAEPVESSYRDLESLLRRAAPAIFFLPQVEGASLLALVKGGEQTLHLLDPAGAQMKVPIRVVRDALTAALVAARAPSVAGALKGAGLTGADAERARDALLREWIAGAPVGGCWLLRPGPAASVGAVARESGLGLLMAAFMLGHLGALVCNTLAWLLLGRGALGGRLDRGWLTAWLLLLFTALPLRVLSSWAGGLLAVRAGAALKRRLLAGAVSLVPEEIRHLGVGQLLGRVLESEVIEQTAFTGGLVALTALFDLLWAEVVLAISGCGLLPPLALAAWVAGLSVLGARYLRRARNLTVQRLDLTNELVERMVGQRTRVAQEPRDQWNQGEDQALVRYLGAATELDRTGARLMALGPRGWLVLGLAVLMPTFLTASSDLTALALGVGGLLLAQQALQGLLTGFTQLSTALIAWERVQLFWQAARRHGVSVAPALHGTDAGPAAEAGSLLLQARKVTFRHADRAEPVLRDVEVRLHVGDRVLLEGPSGGGKSTLAHVLSGGRDLASGLLLLGGLDRPSLGADAWRRRVVLAPQFHENHIFNNTLAFNLLVGRCWPPGPDDLAEAERLCRALELGPLLDRMPARLQQLVGESGWQLSHGEKSRVYLARALLQGADVVILDECLAALDPPNLRRALELVMAEARTVIMIAHP
jgi:ATP-binding cassette subfamily B protein